MKSKMRMIALAGALSLAHEMAAQSGSQPFAFANQGDRESAAAMVSSQRYSQGQRSILELMAERLDFSREQAQQLQSLIGRQQQMITILHQNSRLDDRHKQDISDAIRQQTKDQFIAMLTPEQRRQFGWMQRLPRKTQPASDPEAGQKSHLSAAELDQILNSVESDSSAAAPK